MTCETGQAERNGKGDVGATGARGEAGQGRPDASAGSIGCSCRSAPAGSSLLVEAGAGGPRAEALRSRQGAEGAGAMGWLRDQATGLVSRV